MGAEGQHHHHSENSLSLRIKNTKTDRWRRQDPIIHTQTHARTMPCKAVPDQIKQVVTVAIAMQQNAREKEKSTLFHETQRSFGFLPLPLILLILLHNPRQLLRHVQFPILKQPRLHLPFLLRYQTGNRPGVLATSNRLVLETRHQQ